MQVLKEDIRGRILAVAEQRFGQQGYSKTSMREIAGAVGVGVGNIYNYFRNKDELFCEVVRPVLHAMEAMLQEHHGIRGEDVMTMRSEKYLKACIDEYVSLIETHRSLLEILLFRAQGSSLEHFRESYTDRSTGLVKAWFAAMKKKVSGYKYGRVRLHHSPAYGVDVHAVRGTVDARSAQAGNGIHSARLYSV